MQYICNNPLIHTIGKYAVLCVPPAALYLVLGVCRTLSRAENESRDTNVTK